MRGTRLISAFFILSLASTGLVAIADTKASSPKNSLIRTIDTIIASEKDWTDSGVFAPYMLFWKNRVREQLFLIFAPTNISGD
jgi:hypothetical protein